MNRQSALNIVRRAAPDVRSRYGVVGAQPFGSVARGDGDDRSDIDVAIRFEGGRPADVMKLCGVSGLLSSLFEADVDIVVLPARDPGLNAAIEREAAIQGYESKFTIDGCRRASR
ncbi:MAG: nucleotidyltransferase family protein [Caulobacteraceae bacterium]